MAYKTDKEVWLWQEVQDQRILSIFDQERAKLGILERDIILWEPETLDDCDQKTSSSYKINNETYAIKLHPRHSHSKKIARRVLRHELAHIAFGHCDMADKLRKYSPLDYLYRVFIAEPQAQRYSPIDARTYWGMR